MSWPLKTFVLLVAAVMVGGQVVAAVSNASFSDFVGLMEFSGFTRSQSADGQAILLSPEIKSHAVGQLNRALA
jgi:hypothetical protein